MRPRSATFDAAVANSYTIAPQATLVTVAGEEFDLPIEAGSVNLDAAAASRAALSLTVPVEEGSPLIPAAEGDPLAPYGNEIAAVYGIVTPDGISEQVQLGVFRIDEVALDDSGDELRVEVSGLDRSAIVIDAVFEEAGTVAAGTNALQMAALVVASAYPEASFDFVSSSVTLPLLSYEKGDDRWDFASGCAEAAGCVLYFDANGVCVARPFPETDAADLVIAEGEGGILLAANKQWGRENACNRVVTSGENPSGDPVFGEAIDDDPASPTFYDGPFGKVTFTYDSEYITTDEQAQQVAETILAQRRGTGYVVGFEALVNPALEPYDVIQVRRERIGVDELHVLDSLQIPLDGEGSMSGTTRLARVL